MYTDPDGFSFPQQFEIYSGTGGTFTAQQLVNFLNADSILIAYGISFSWDSVTNRFSIINSGSFSYTQIYNIDSQLGFVPNSPPYTQTIVAPNAPSPANPQIFTNAGYGVSANSTQWVAVGSGTNSLAYSSNGINWTGIGESIFNYGYDCVWNPSNALWVAVGNNDPTQPRNTIIYSSDGVNWTTVSSSPFDNPMGFSSGYCVATAILPPNLFGNNITTYKYPQVVMNSNSDNGYTASASSSLDPVTFAPFKAFDGITTGFLNIWHSSDDLNSRYNDNTGSYEGMNETTTNMGTYRGEWIQLDLNQSIMLKSYTIYPREFFETTRAPQMFALVGRTLSTSTWTLIDFQSNLTWTASTPKTFTIPSPTIETSSLRLITIITGNASEPSDKQTVNLTEIEFNALTPPNKKWVAGGYSPSHSLAYSTDGINWSGAGNTVFSSCFGVAWNGKLWVAVGSDFSNWVATSTDGINWTGRGKPAGINIGRKICWNGSFWIATGEPSLGGNCLAYSQDGINWTGSTGTSIFSIIGVAITSRFSLL